MISLSISSSTSSVHSVRSPTSLNDISPLPSPSPSSSHHSPASSSSSSSSSNYEDDENVTITANRPMFKWKGKGRSHEDLQLLAISSRMTELSYNISDIQTRIFEIQELRHKSQSATEPSNTTGVIDQSLSSLDERLETVTTGIKSINKSLEPLFERSEKTPTIREAAPTEEAVILRKHAAMVGEWDALQKEIQVLREELKEDKWLTVFRTVTDQADGMMSSLEKAVNRCQDFIWQVQRQGLEDAISRSSSSSIRSDKSPMNQDMFNSLQESYEAKKKHYMPATTKVLSIIDKGVQDRVTKNGECLRRHAESTQRWRNLKERIARTDSEMEAVHRIYMGGDALSEAGSSTSGTTSKSKSRTKNGLLTSPSIGPSPMKERSPSTNTLSRSISPFRKLARKLTRSTKSPAPTTPVVALKTSSRMPSSEPARTLRHRSSMLNFMGSQPPTPFTPSHKHTHSLTPESSPSSKKLERLEASAQANSTLRSNRPAWNSSTKVEEDERMATLKSSPRRPSVSSTFRSSEDVPPMPPLYPLYYRSASRSSMASSRPWSPVTSSVSTAQSSSTPFSMFRPPSRSQAQTPSLPVSYRPPSRSQTPGLSGFPRTRPKTPSHIPMPSRSHFRSMSTSPSDTSFGPDGLEHRALSPNMRSHTPGGDLSPARPPSRSMIPIPSVQVSAASRPSSAMSDYRPDSSMSFRGYANGARTPDILAAMRSTPRPSVIRNGLPPSSFRDNGASPRTPGTGSRPPSRAGAATPNEGGKPLHEYGPPNPRDPLDVEIARIANSLPHCLLIERIDPPLRGAPKEGEEIRAQYAFAGPLARKVVACKLTTLARPAAKGVTKKVMCRVGGGWQDLHLYVMSRQT